MFGYHTLGFGSNINTKTYIKSIQTGSITIATSATSNTATITGVDTTKSVCFLNGWTTPNDAGDFYRQTCIVELTNATTVTAKRGASDASNTSTVYYTIVEFTSDAVSTVQSGEISMGGGVGSNTATITSVGTSNSICITRGSTIVADFGVTASIGDIQLTNATTVTASRAAINSTCTVAYTVIEFQPTIVQSLQNIDDTTSTTAAANTDETISAVTTANTGVFVRGRLGASTFFANNSAFRCQLTSTTNVRFTKVGTDSSVRRLRATVIEFKPLIIKTINRGTIGMNTAQTSNTATVTAVNINKSLLNFMQSSTSSTSPATANDACACELTNSTTITARRNTSASSSVTVAYELIEFY